MLARLGLSDKLMRAAVSGYELGTIEPPLTVILEYARAAGVCTDALIDDKEDLPEKLPAKPRHSPRK
jgi:hypothetical protein